MDNEMQLNTQAHMAAQSLQVLKLVQQDNILDIVETRNHVDGSFNTVAYFTDDSVAIYKDDDKTIALNTLDDASVYMQAVTETIEEIIKRRENKDENH